MNHITEAALTNPQLNARFVPCARRKALDEVEVLEQCLAHLPSDHPEHAAISAEVQRINTLLEATG